MTSSCCVGELTGMKEGGEKSASILEIHPLCSQKCPDQELAFKEMLFFSYCHDTSFALQACEVWLIMPLSQFSQLMMIQPLRSTKKEDLKWTHTYIHTYKQMTRYWMYMDSVLEHRRIQREYNCFILFQCSFTLMPTWDGLVLLDGAFCLL